MSIKRRVLSNIDKIPTPISFLLMKINRNPEFVFGSKYKQYFEMLKSGKLERPEKRLVDLYNSIIESTPYYSENNYTKISSVSDFEKLVPIIEKDTVMSNFDDFMNRNVDISSYDKGTTGGTSGRPLKLIMPPERYIVELATLHYTWSKIGFNFDVRAVIRNHRLPPNKDYLVNPITKEVIFDGFRLNDDYFLKVYNVMRKNRISFIHCYPSVAYGFSKFLLKNKLDISFLRAFLCSSENVLGYQKEFIVNNLGVSFLSFYGHSEKLIFASSGFEESCVSEDYTIEPNYGYFELIDSEDRVIRDVDVVGELVGTTLNNYGMPLIRYRTGDFASYKIPPTDKSPGILKSILGRWRGDKIYNSDGTFVTTTALNLHSELYEKIDGIQYFQDTKGELVINIIKNDKFSEEDLNALTYHFESKMNSDTIIKIFFVDEMKKNANGKFLLLTSNITSY